MHLSSTGDYACILQPGHSGGCIPAHLTQPALDALKPEAYTPRRGDIGMVAMPGWVGRAIRAGQWLNGDGFKNYQHAFTVVGNHVRGSDTGPGDTMKIIEAMPGGALLSPLSRYDGFAPVYLRCPDEYRDAVADLALSFEGIKYSALDYDALALHRFHIPAPGLRHFIDATGHMICSQMADRAADLAGWHLFDDNRWPGYVVPLDIYSLYEKQLVQ